MFNLSISTGGAAFGEDAIEESYEIARILREIANRIEGSDTTGGGANDINGNRVASWERD